jgi:hypothetical protein
MARQDYQPTSQQQYPDLERMVQQRRLGYLDQQALLRSLNQQRMLQGQQPAHSLEEAVAAPLGASSRPRCRVSDRPAPVRLRGSRVESTSAPQDSGYGSALASGDFGAAAVPVSSLSYRCHDRGRQRGPRQDQLAR